MRIAIQTSKQREKEWEIHHRGGIMSGIAFLFSTIATYKDRNIKPAVRKELESVLETTLRFWNLKDYALEYYDTWPDEHLPDFLIEWRDNK